MKLTSVEIHPDNSSNVAVLSFRDPNAINPYNVKGIVGLDADTIVPRHYGSSGSSDFYNLSLEKRTIVVKVGLNPNFTSNATYSDLRDDLYRMIASARTGKVQLQFKNGSTVIAAISGFVSKFEAALFEKLQEAQITVECDEPTLKAMEPDTVEIAGFNPSNFTISDNKSTAPHGFTFNLGVTFGIPSIKITDPDDMSWSFEIVPAGGFITGDELYFSSELNNKSLSLVRGGTDTIYLADVVTPGSIWPIIFPGDNTFSFTNPTHLRFDGISYFPSYWGV